MYIQLVRRRWIMAAALLLAGSWVLAMRADHSPEAAASHSPQAGRPVLVAAVAPASRPANAYTGVVAARTDSGLGFRVGGKIVERRVDPGIWCRAVTRCSCSTWRTSSCRCAPPATLPRRGVPAAPGRGRRTALPPARRRRRRGATYLRAGIDLAARRPGGGVRARAEASQIENRRNYSTLHADGAGVITEVRVERGQVVAAGQIVVRLAHDGPREAVDRLPETPARPHREPARGYAFGDSEARRRRHAARVVRGG